MKKVNENYFGAGDTGRIFEARFMGSAVVDPQFVQELARLPRAEGYRFPKKVDVFRLYEKFYKGDLTNPTGIHAKELRLAVADELGLSEEQLERLRFYSTLQTPIDVLMGVDGFLSYQEAKNRPEQFVTLDATLRTRKIKEGAKADVLIGELPDAVQEEDAYFEAIQGYAQQIAQKFQLRA